MVRLHPGPANRMLGLMCRKLVEADTPREDYLEVVTAAMARHGITHHMPLDWANKLKPRSAHAILMFGRLRDKHTKGAVSGKRMRPQFKRPIMNKAAEQL